MLLLYQDKFNFTQPVFLMVIHFQHSTFCTDFKRVLYFCYITQFVFFILLSNWLSHIFSYIQKNK
jgi:hypothetical protein